MKKEPQPEMGYGSMKIFETVFLRGGGVGSFAQPAQLDFYRRKSGAITNVTVQSSLMST